MDTIFTTHGIDSVKLFDLALGWLLGPGLRIVIILLFAWIAGRIGKLSITRALNLALHDIPGDVVANIQIAKRRQTMESLFVTILRVVIFALAILMILRDVGFEIAPILASAGIVGVAIGLGGQSLVKDIIAGSFIILEDQFGIGDVVKIGDKSGAVENIGLRTTTLRDQEGIAHIVPNGKIETTSVMTKGWSQIVLDVDVAYHEDIDRAIGAVDKVLKEYVVQFPTNSLGEPQVLGVESFGENSVKIRSTLKTAPGKQWDAARLIRRRLRDELANVGIQLPFQQNIAWVQTVNSARSPENETKELSGGQITISTQTPSPQ